MKKIKQGQVKPTRVDRTLMWLIRNIPRVNRIFQYGLTEAYELGYNHGVLKGSRINGKSSYRKAKKALNDIYSTEKLPKA
jgi:hypothetical protein